MARRILLQTGVFTCPVCHRPATCGSGLPAGAPCRAAVTFARALAPRVVVCSACPGRWWTDRRPGAGTPAPGFGSSAVHGARRRAGAYGLVHDGRATRNSACSRSRLARRGTRRRWRHGSGCCRRAGRCRRPSAASRPARAALWRLRLKLPVAISWTSPSRSLAGLHLWRPLPVIPR
jgi:hypothetical protein